MSTAPSLTGEVLRFALEAVKGPHKGQKFEFNRTSITIGRGPENDIVLSEDPRVSRQHCEIKQSLGQFYLINLSQKNFILLNGQNVQSEKMDPKSTIQVGETEMMFTVQGSTNFLEPVSPGSVSLQRPPGAPAGAPTAGPRPLPNSVPNPPPFGGGVPAPMGSGSPAPMPGGSPAPWMPPAPGGPPPGANPFQYSAPPPRPAAPPPSPIGQLLGNKRVRVYGVLIFIGLIAFMALKSTRKERVDNRAFRTAEEIDATRQLAESDMKVFRDRRDKMQAMIYQKAYENFLRGYRDYRLGQYARARDAFQVVLNLDPENELGKRYYNLAKIRFDEVVKFHMLQGRRYLEKQNYRMCRSNLQTVMTMLGNDPSNPEYKEAKMLHEQCTAAQEGRY